MPARQPGAGILPAFFPISSGMDFAVDHGLFRHPGLLAGSLMLAFALWIIFVASTNPHELLVGFLVCAITVLSTVVVARSTAPRLEFRVRDLAQCWRIPWYVLSGVFDITLVLFKDLPHIAPAKNLFRVCGFDSSTHDPLRIARTALAVVYTTTAPNFIVVDVDPSQSRMLFHQIEESSVPKMTKALGARA
jgi:multisubunit Na+/H+ antiporter MnhE subunit